MIRPCLDRDRLEQPGLQCLDMIVHEMQRMINQSDILEWQRFPDLKEKTMEVILATSISAMSIKSIGCDVISGHSLFPTKLRCACPAHDPRSYPDRTGVHKYVPS